MRIMTGLLELMTWLRKAGLSFTVYNVMLKIHLYGIV